MRNHPGEAVETDWIGAGSQEDHVVIRQAQLSDVPAMLRLVNDYAARAIMLPRSELELCESLRDFLVATEDGEFLGCGALHFYTQHMAELRSLAVIPQRTGSGLGLRLGRELLEQAHQYGVDVVFVFTYVPGFFGKLGFEEVDRKALPLKAWKDCLRCPKFHACDEIAMAYLVKPGAELYMDQSTAREAATEAFSLFPILGQPRILDKG